MKLLLIRHGETVDNVAHKYAGVTDSHLTNHGVLQILCLGDYLTTRKSAGGAGLTFTHIFSSDLQRARKTGQAILDAQLANSDGVDSPPSFSAAAVTQLFELREVDFGSREGSSYKSSHVPAPPVSRDPDYQSRESNESMAARADRFIDDHLMPAVMETHYTSAANTKHHAIAVASHGIFLAILWTRLMARFYTTAASDFSGKRLHWSNTGYILLDLLPGAPEEGLRGCRCLVEGVNVKTHLQGLGRIGGGIGSAKADEKQRRIGEFFTAKHPEAGVGRYGQ